MRTRDFYFASIVMLAAFAVGCEKAKPPESQNSQIIATQNEAALRIHWVGTKRLAGDTNAIPFLALWNAPESMRMKTQTLDRVSIVPWRLMGASPNALPSTNPLRPLLEDLLREEAYLEVNLATNRSPEFAFAIHLDQDRVGLWETNMAAVFRSLTDAPITPSTDGRHGWSLRKQESPNLIELTRIGEWTVVGASDGDNSSFRKLCARVQESSTLLAPGATRNWLEASIDLASIAAVPPFGDHFSNNAPRLRLTISGNGKNLQTHGELTFREEIPIHWEPWHFPTNLVHEPLTEFGAVRGFKPWLASWKVWRDLNVGAPPNEFYWWAQHRPSVQVEGVVPLADASNWVDKVSNRIVTENKEWLATNRFVKFERSQTRNGLEWKGAPLLFPRMESIDSMGKDFVLVSLWRPSQTTNSPPPPELLDAIFARTNLMGYEWEITGPRIEAWLYISQFMRLVSNRVRLSSDSTGLLWLNAMVARLGNSITEIEKTGPRQISFQRSSDMGFTAMELLLLVDWLDSPEFPYGLSSLHSRLPRTPPATSPSAPGKP